MTAIPSLASNPTFAPTSADPSASSSSPPKSGPSTSHPPSDPARATSPNSFQPPSGSLVLNGSSNRGYKPLPTSISATSSILSPSSALKPDDSPPSFVNISRPPPQSMPSDGMIATTSMAGSTDWEAAFHARRVQEFGRKVFQDLEGWRGGIGKPRSSYPRAALPKESYFGQPQTGTIGVHLPKEMVRVERDWSGGEVCQFETMFPMELEGRITAKEFINFIQTLNDILLQAYSIKGAVIDNAIGVVSLWTSLWWRVSTFERGLRRVEAAISEANVSLFNPAGLNVLTPRDVALQFLEIEYY